MNIMTQNFTSGLRDAAVDYMRRAGALEAMMRACDHAGIDCTDFERQAKELRARAADVRRFMSGSAR